MILANSVRIPADPQLVDEIRDEYKSRRDSVNRGNETKELAAALLDKFCWGLTTAVNVAGIENRFQDEADRLVRDIDPNFDVTRQARWGAKPASLVFSQQNDSTSEGE